MKLYIILNSVLSRILGEIKFSEICEYKTKSNKGDVYNVVQYDSALYTMNKDPDYNAISIEFIVVKNQIQYPIYLVDILYEQLKRYKSKAYCACKHQNGENEFKW